MNEEKTFVKVSSVYVAASSMDVKRAEHWTNHLAAAGLDVTSTWINTIVTIGEANPRGVDRGIRLEYAKANVDAIVRAQLLWFLVPKPPMATCGAWWEAGVASAHGRIVVSSGEDTEQSVFTALGQEFKDDLLAFATICRLAREGAWK